MCGFKLGFKVRLFYSFFFHNLFQEQQTIDMEGNLMEESASVTDMWFSLFIT